MGKSINISALYQGFSVTASNRGFGKSAPERRTLRDRQTITVATDVGSTSNPLKVEFFTTAAQPNVVIRSNQPKILDGAGIPKDTLIGLFGVALRFNHGSYAGTLTESTEVLAALGDAVVNVKIGDDVLVSLSGYECIVGSPGFDNTTDTATATATVRSALKPGTEPFLLEWARVIEEQATLAAELLINKTTWTTNDNIQVFLELLCWVAHKGSPVASSAQNAAFPR